MLPGLEESSTRASKFTLQYLIWPKPNLLLQQTEVQITSTIMKDDSGKHSESADKRISSEFQRQLQDIYDTEHQLATAAPLMLKNAILPATKKAIQWHLAAARRHLKRLNRIFRYFDLKARIENAHKMEGLLRKGIAIVHTQYGDEYIDPLLVRIAVEWGSSKLTQYSGLFDIVSKWQEKEIERLLYRSYEEEQDVARTLLAEFVDEWTEYARSNVLAEIGSSPLELEKILPYVFLPPSVWLSKTTLEKNSRTTQDLDYPRLMAGKKEKEGERRGRLTREFDRPQGLAVNVAISRLEQEVIPAITRSKIKDIESILRQSQKNPPESKTQFVTTVNRLLDTFHLRIQAHGECYRLRVSKNARGAESVQLVSRERGKGRGFINTKFELTFLEQAYVSTEIEPHLKK